MFERLRLLGSAERGIVLQTHKGREIENAIGAEPGPQELAKQARFIAPFQGRWKERKPPCGIYNCVGHVWASRRTAVYAPGMEDKIDWLLGDDGYRKLGEGEPVYPGDLALYWDAEPKVRSFLHVGMVTRLAEGISRESPLVPFVLSKWSDTSGEYEHNCYDHPYHQHTQRLVIEFWTERRSREVGS
jgi:hypothetical protein